MTPRKSIAIAAAVAAITGLAMLPQVRASGDKVAYPADYDKGVLYTTVDRADVKQFRELWAPRAAIDAVKAGKPIPSGTVLTMVNFAAQLGPDGNPVKDANGRFIKTNLLAYNVMEKRTGWGTEYADNVRNGEWEYQLFNPAKQVNAAANLTTCFACHKPMDKDDYTFSIERMKNTAR
jgi:hypothetical protein